jgi:cell division septation protein DedD
LGDLVSRHNADKTPLGRSAMDLSPTEVTFPRMLSDDDRPTTALAAVRPSGSGAPFVAASAPPPPTDRLPVVPLPAQTVLEATPIVTRPRDALTKVATDAAQITTPPESSDTAAAGHDGGYQLQVSSFHTQPEANAFADQLRARGHHAYVLEARVPGRGTWYRVRVGPFTTQHAATQYRSSFEAKEHVVPFIVPPETTAKAH